MDAYDIAKKLMYVMLGCGLTTGVLAVTHEFRPAEVFAVVTGIVSMVAIAVGFSTRRKPE